MRGSNQFTLILTLLCIVLSLASLEFSAAFSGPGTWTDQSSCFFSGAIDSYAWVNCTLSAKIVAEATQIGFRIYSSSFGAKAMIMDSTNFASFLTYRKAHPIPDISQLPYQALWTTNCFLFSSEYSTKIPYEISDDEKDMYLVFDNQSNNPMFLGTQVQLYFPAVFELARFWVPLITGILVIFCSIGIFCIILNVCIHRRMQKRRRVMDSSFTSVGSVASAIGEDITQSYIN